MSISMNILEFLSDGNEENIREIARVLDISPTTVSKYLLKLEKDGLVDRRKKANLILVRVNQSSKKIKLIKRHKNERELFDSGLIDFLNDSFFNPSIVLYGSYSLGENNSKSDIDIFLVSSVKKDVNLNKFENKLGREIHLIVKNEKEFKKMELSNKNLFNNVINGTILSGHLEVFK